MKPLSLFIFHYDYPRLEPYNHLAKSEDLNNQNEILFMPNTSLNYLQNKQRCLQPLLRRHANLFPTQACFPMPNIRKLFYIPQSVLLRKPVTAPQRKSTRYPHSRKSVCTNKSVFRQRSYNPTGIICEHLTLIKLISKQSCGM